MALVLIICWELKINIYSMLNDKNLLQRQLFLPLKSQNNKRKIERIKKNKMFSKTGEKNARY